MCRNCGDTDVNFREYVLQEDLTKAARKVGDAKKHESASFPLQLVPNLTYPSSQTRVFGVVFLPFSPSCTSPCNCYLFFSSTTISAPALFDQARGSPCVSIKTRTRLYAHRAVCNARELGPGVSTHLHTNQCQLCPG